MRIPSASESWFSLPEALTSMLITLPCIFASATYSAMSGISGPRFPPLSIYSDTHAESDILGTRGSMSESRKMSVFVDAAILTSGTLLTAGIFAKMQTFSETLEKDKAVPGASLDFKTLFKMDSLRLMTSRSLSVLLPFYASMLLGGSRAALIMLLAVSSGLTCSNAVSGSLFEQWKEQWGSKVGTSAAILLCFIIDEVGLTIEAPVMDVILGYLALAVSVLVLPSSFPILASVDSSRVDSKPCSSAHKSDQWLQRRNSAEPWHGFSARTFDCRCGHDSCQRSGSGSYHYGRVNATVVFTAYFNSLINF